jgi:prophage maintenance system killer protein
MIARAAGAPYDAESVARLVVLRKHLENIALPEVPDTSVTSGARIAASFFEAYLSNYIEGTRFPVVEANLIVFKGHIPEQRPQDGRDVLETYKQIVDLGSRAPSTLDYDDFREEIRSRHAALMAARPEIGPGAFKVIQNHSGSTVFVAPSLVDGTLREGVSLINDVSHPFARAALIHFMLTDVHPFADGNGRLSRIMMTKELLAAKQSRIVIPTVHREDYVDTLRLLSRTSDPAPLIRCLMFCQKVTAATHAPDLPRALLLWASTFAFQEPNQQRLRMPDPTDIIEWRNGVPGPKSHWNEEEDTIKAYGFQL